MSYHRRGHNPANSGPVVVIVDDRASHFLAASGVQEHDESGKAIFSWGLRSHGVKNLAEAILREIGLTDLQINAFTNLAVWNLTDGSLSKGPWAIDLQRTAKVLDDAFPDGLETEITELSRFDRDALSCPSKPLLLPELVPQRSVSVDR